jgi:hypothetical protein
VTFEAPGEQEASERAWAVVREAYETREPVRWPRRHAKPLIAGALVAAVIAAVLSPPGRSVVRSLRSAVGIEKAEPALFSLPTPGHLLVTSRGGLWLVRPDGSKRNLGRYGDAASSPHGLFVAATRANQLVALDPKGGVRWTLARPGPRFPAWTGTRTDTRIAYISAGGLHVVAGDGTGDRPLAAAARVPPVWRPGPRRVVAYAPSPKTVAVVDADTRAVLRRFRSNERVRKLQWSGDGRLLLVFAPHASRVYDLRGRVVAADDPSDATFDVDAAFVPHTHEVVAIRAEGLGSSVFSIVNGRTLFRGTGRFDQLAFSPNGRWLLVSWPTANQWVFVRAGRHRKIVGASRISAQFGSFPRVEGWCCAP